MGIGLGMSLALSTLIYEWRRYLAAVIALAIAGMLVLLMVGLFLGIIQAFNAAIVRSPADIIVLNPKASSLINNSSGLPRRLIGQIYMDPDVVEVSDLEANGGFWRNDPKAGGANGGASSNAKAVGTFVNTYAVDTRPGAVTLPTDFGPDVRIALEEPYAVAIEETDQHKLGAKLGEKASLNGHTVTVAAYVHDYASADNSIVFMSRQTARLLGLASTGPNVGPLMVHIKDPSQAERVRAELNAHSEDLYRAWTRNELADANQSSLLQIGIIATMLIGGLLLGTFVGVIITWQTMQGALMANIKEFASLRALGVSMGSLRIIVMELSFWVGVAGLIFTAVLTWAFTMLAAAFNLPMLYPLPYVIVVVVMLMIIAIVSGFLSLGVLKKSQPADLLR
jgi:putative ABC transport system permease protein